jgi:hypothetical protein
MRTTGTGQIHASAQESNTVRSRVRAKSTGRDSSSASTVPSWRAALIASPWLNHGCASRGTRRISNKMSVADT